MPATKSHTWARVKAPSAAIIGRIAGRGPWLLLDQIGNDGLFRVRWEKLPQLQHTSADLGAAVDVFPQLRIFPEPPPAA
jgi:hypothetical protein